MVSLEGESSEKEVDGVLLCLGMPNGIPYHVWYIYYRDREEHMSHQGYNGHLMLHGIDGEGYYCT